MKKLTLLFAALVFVAIPIVISSNSSVSTVNTVSEVNSSVNSNTYFLQSFNVSNIQEMNSNVNNYTFTLNEGVNYQLSASNNIQSINNDNVLMKIYNMNGKLLGTNMNTKTGKIYSKLNFVCASTGTYKVSFEINSINSDINENINENNVNNVNNVVSLSFQS